MNHGSLFSGIGGFDLAAEWMGWNNVFHCEIDPFGQKVLNYYWPNAISYEDITKTDFAIWRGKIDIITGGFPCQPFSAAGKRKGTEDDRHLWPQMLRAIQEIAPVWVVGENVSGLVNWSGGLVFEQVQLDLEAEGYEVQPVILPAVSVNAPHRRDRVWFVAYRAIKGREEREQDNGWAESEKDGSGVDNRPERSGCNGPTPDPHNTGTREQLRTDGGGQEENKRRQGQPQPEFRETGGDASNSNIRGLEGGEGIDRRQKYERERGGLRNTTTASSCNWENFPTQPPICGGNDGIPRSLDSITFSKWRNESIKAYGNAIVPQVALQIFKSIQQITPSSY